MAERADIPIALPGGAARAAAVSAWALVALVTLSGCVLAPAGTRRERLRADDVGLQHGFGVAFEGREISELPPEPTWRDVLRRAFLVNGELEAAYFDWRAALERIDQAAGYPNTNLGLSFQYMFSGGNMKAWDRTTVLAQPDPMQNLAFPTKVAQAGRVALAEARAAGERFAARKFDLQRRVLSAYTDYGLLAERTRIQRQNVELLSLVYDTAAQRVEAGGAQQDLLRTQIELRLAQDALRNLEAEAPQAGASLNALMGREPTAPLPPPAALPDPRPIPADDARLLALGVSANPELTALAREVEGRRDALELARMKYIPDINPMAAFTGSAQQMVGAMVMVPITIPQIRASIREARDTLRSSEAMLRQAGLDRDATFVATLYALRNAERRVGLFEGTVVPDSEQVVSSLRESYATGGAGFLDLVEGQRALLDARLTLAEAKAAREKRLAELEQLAGTDIETLATPASRPADASASEPAADPPAAMSDPAAVEVSRGH